MLRLRNHLALIATTSAIAAHVALVAAMIASSARSRHAPFAANAEPEWHIVPLPPPVATAVPIIPIAPPPDEIGEKGGKGEAISTVASPDVARSPKPADFQQAWTRQQPTFAPPPSPPASPQPRRAEQAKREPARPDEQSQAAELASRQETALPFGTLPMPAKANDAPPLKGDVDTKEQAKATDSSEVSPTPPMSPEQPPAAAGSPPVDATPAPQGPSDLDAFAQQEGVDFSSGGMQARQGREVKLVRPRVDLSFMADATALSGKGIDVTLQVQTDEHGKPRRVDIMKSSGSSTIDDAVRQAAYASWFGAPMPDRFPFTVRFLR